MKRIIVTLSTVASLLAAHVAEAATSPPDPKGFGGLIQVDPRGYGLISSPRFWRVSPDPRTWSGVIEPTPKGYGLRPNPIRFSRPDGRWGRHHPLIGRWGRSQ